jgi:medium-chain acyl-[acyl-carrier-protein] hydrolase
MMPNRAARVRLVCFPYAGGSASAFKSWDAELLPNIESYGIQLPGRGTRIREPLLSNLDDVVPDVSAAIAPLFDKPCVFFGHSLGALLAFEVNRWLRRERRVSCSHLFVSGRRAPHMLYNEPAKSAMSDEELVQTLCDLRGTSSEILDNPELLEVLLPVLRADFRLGETYRYRDDEPLTCPITALGGTEDDESLDDRLDGWRRHTTGRFAKYLFGGGHFFVKASSREVLQSMRTELYPTDVALL